MTVNIAQVQLPGFKNTSEYLENLKSVVNAPENPVLYLSGDPGKHTGICGYDRKYYLQFMLNVPADAVNMFLHQFEKVRLCVLEDYKLFPNKAEAQYYSDMETPRVIGRFESWAEVKAVELVMQAPTIKNTGYAWLGKKPPAVKKRQNPMDAHVHFMYWAIKNGKVKAKRDPLTQKIVYMAE